MYKFLNYCDLYFDDANTNTDGNNTSAQNNTDDKNADNNAGNTSAQNKNADDNAGEKKYTDADLDKIIEKKFAKWQKQKAAEIDEATKLANMNAQEKAEHERDKLKAELEALKHANVMSEMEKTARGILQASGVNVSDDIVAHLVAEDAETTSKNVKDFATAFKKAVQAEVKAQLSHKAPVTGNAGAGVTRETINKETNPLKRQQLIRENMSLFNNKK